MQRKILKTLVLVLSVVSVLTLLAWWWARPQPVAVVVRAVEVGRVQESVANTRAGTVKPCRRAGLSPSIGGQIVSLPVREGDRVKKGDLLMELWSADRQAEMLLARNETRAAHSRTHQACVKAEVARREAQRLHSLREKKLASEEAVDKAEGEAAALAAACQAAQASEEVAASRIKVAEAALERTRLQAPFDGTVAQLNGEIGEFVTPSPVGIPTPPAVDLIDDSCIYVAAPMDEVDAPRIRVGMPGNISLDAFKGRIFRGKVRRIAPYVKEVEKQARTVEVEADLEEAKAGDLLLPGYSADLEVILEERDAVLRVPTDAIMEGNRVYLFRQDEPLEERVIETGIGNWAWTEVKNGLEEGDLVVISVDREGVQAGAVAVLERSADDDRP